MNELAMVCTVGMLATALGACGGSYANANYSPPPEDAESAGYLPSTGSGQAVPESATESEQPARQAGGAQQVVDELNRQQQQITQQSQQNVDAYRQLTERPQPPQNGSSGHEGLCLDGGQWVPTHAGCAASAR
jgi:hypothetical protein